MFLTLKSPGASLLIACERRRISGRRFTPPKNNGVKRRPEIRLRSQATLLKPSECSTIFTGFSLLRRTASKQVRCTAGAVSQFSRAKHELLKFRFLCMPRDEISLKSPFLLRRRFVTQHFRCRIRAAVSSFLHVNTSET